MKNKRYIVNLNADNTKVEVDGEATETPTLLLIYMNGTQTRAEVRGKISDIANSLYTISTVCNVSKLAILIAANAIIDED